MKFSLVIPTYNRKETLEACLTAASQQDYPEYEVIVVDDASTDGTEDMVRQNFPQLGYYRQETNRGPAAARNRGIQEASGDIIAFTDDDCLVPLNFLSELARGYRNYPQVVGVGGYLAAADEVLKRNIFARYEMHVNRHIYHVGSEPYVGGFECPAGGTNSMSYRRDILQEVHNFDEAFPVAAGEDADLKLRVVQSGYQLLYIPVKVIHLRPYDLSSFLRQHRTRGRSIIYFEQKHYGFTPSTFRMILRGGIRLLRWLPDTLTSGPRLATVKLLAELMDLAGQWQELRNSRTLR